MEPIEITIKNNETILSKENRIYLTYENSMLIPCTLTQKEDEFTLNFEICDLKPLEDIHNKSLKGKYRVLINCMELKNLRNEYYFSLDPENLVYDFNYLPKVIMRDAPIKDDDFLGEYKALIATILHPKYKFEDYYNGGKDLFKKKRILKQIKKLETVEEIKEFMLNAYNNESLKIKQNKLLVNKKNVIASRILIPIMTLIFVAICIKGYFVMFVDLPYKDSLIEANNAFIAEDYIGAQNALKSVKVEKIPLSNKYILARSYVIMESLTDEQKENVLAGITLKTDERVLNYWIELGRLNFEGAVDNAKRLGDNDLLLFALVKQCTAIKNDTTITGEEKVTITESLESQIKELKEQMENQKAELDQNSTDDISDNSVN